MDIEAIFNPAAPLRSSEEWKDILLFARAEFEAFVGHPVVVTDYTLEDDKKGYASSDNGIDVIIDCQRSLGLTLCGVIACGINRNENVAIDGEFLAFIAGKRFTDGERDCLHYSYMKEGSSTAKWVCHGWDKDMYGEWESYRDCSRWKKP